MSFTANTIIGVIIVSYEVHTSRSVGFMVSTWTYASIFASERSSVRHILEHTGSAGIRWEMSLAGCQGSEQLGSELWQTVRAEREGKDFNLAGQGSVIIIMAKS